MLPAKYRLKGRKEFNNLFHSGKTFSNDVLQVKIGKGDSTKPSQFGFGASLKFSKHATERNKVKRWMREAVRAKLAEIQPGHRLIFFINPKISADMLNLKLIQEKVENLLKKGKIMN